MKTRAISHILWGILGALLLALKTAAAEVPPVREFKGAINDDLKITMKLSFRDKEVSGTYYYDKYKKDIKLSGSADASGGLELKEYDPRGAVTGSFSGELSPAGLFQGSWSSPDGSKVYPFRLKETGSDAAPAGAWVKPGEWSRQVKNAWSAGDLTIGHVTARDFGFSLEVMSGSHTGGVSGRAVITGDRALFTDRESNCQITFIRKTDLLILSVSEGCSYYAGAGVTFDGEYKFGPETPASRARKDRTALTELGVFNSADRERAFADLVGPAYDRFVDSFHLTDEPADQDGFGAAVVTGRVLGLPHEYEAIIMQGPEGKLWAAVIEDEKVKYFTNVREWKGKLPRTLETWREDFAFMPVEYQKK